MTKIDSALCRIAGSREFESICKTVLGHESGDPGEQFNEKTEGQKSRETVPLILSINNIGTSQLSWPLD
jgi:hypothetical protein